MGKNGKKILIIDDDIDLVEANRVVLEASGYRVVAAYSPSDGAMQMKREAPDLVILDVLFGRNKQSDGFELARRFRMDRDTAGVPILMMTSVNREYPEFGFSAEDSTYIPVDAVLDKPAHPAQLIRKVKELLTRESSRLADWSTLKE
jgi:DNA-binding response OmpR family regulator